MDVRILIFLFMVCVGLTIIAIITYCAYIIEVTLLLAILPFTFFWLLWIRNSGWFLLPESSRRSIKKVFMKKRQ